MTSTNEPTRVGSPAPRHRKGVWGTVGPYKEGQKVYFCISGRALLERHPELAADPEKAKRYLKPGTMWEAISQGHGKYRKLNVHLTHWNPENPRTDQKSRDFFEMLKEECEGVLDVHREQKGEVTAKV